MNNITIYDPVFKNPVYNRLDKYLLQFINDERDLPFIYLTLKLTFLMIPIAILLYFPLNEYLWFGLAVVYLALNNLVFKGSFGLMMHCTSHRKWFKTTYGIMNNYLPWVIGPFFGQTPETYYSHHIGMHHPENNLPEDKSTTMPYQRDSIWSFLSYFLNFLFLGLYRLIGYFIKVNRKKLLFKVIRGEVLFYTMVILLSLWNFPATLVVFILPYIISRLIMMLGNWTQHAFVDANDPGNAYKNSITCINVKYNKKCWNDGYHISHHIHPTMHWTDHPHHFINNREEYARNKALVFNGLDFLQIFFLLMAHNYDKLAAHVVIIDGQFSSKEEIIELMKERTKRIPIAEMAVA